MKGRACLDDRSQRSYIPLEDSVSPTVSIEALILSCVIDANENR